MLNLTLATLKQLIYGDQISFSSCMFGLSLICFSTFGAILKM